MYYISKGDLYKHSPSSTNSQSQFGYALTTNIQAKLLQNKMQRYYVTSTTIANT